MIIDNQTISSNPPNSLPIAPDQKSAFNFGIGLLGLFLWNLFFLNGPAMKKVWGALLNTVLISGLTVVLTLLLALAAAFSLHLLEVTGRQKGRFILLFALNLIRSVPQIIGVLLGYALLSFLITNGVVGNGIMAFVIMACSLSLFIFLEVTDLLLDRIAHFRKSAFYNALRVCGLSESRVVGFNILWNNSRIHILNKLLSVFGMALFLQCSTDFILSVGLSRDAEVTSLPLSLGGLLAHIDSNQDILAMGYTLTHPLYLPHLFLQHLQGLSAAFLIVFTLYSLYKIGNGFSERHR